MELTSREIKYESSLNDNIFNGRGDRQASRYVSRESNL